MISYSTGTSGAGADVEKVREATELAKEQASRPHHRRPASVRCGHHGERRQVQGTELPVAGKATVFVFPT